MRGYEQTEKNVRRMLRVHAPAQVESVGQYQRTCEDEFANLVYRSPEEYAAIIDWLTEPTEDFRIGLVYAGETATRVHVALAPRTGE